MNKMYITGGGGGVLGIWIYMYFIQMCLLYSTVL